MKIAHPLRVSLASSLLLALAATASAQDAMGNGHAMDHNLQLGTGGYNAAGPTIDYNARNNIITGNVAGLSYFHGTINYTAVGQLRTTTAEDSIFPFLSQSYPTGAPGQAYNTYGAPLPIYRSEDPTTVTQLRQLVPAHPFAEPRLASPGPWTVPTLGPEWSGLGTPIQAQVLGDVVQSDGRLLQINASPLLGVRFSDLNTPMDRVPVSTPADQQGQQQTYQLLDLDSNPVAPMPSTEVVPPQTPGALPAGADLGLEIDNSIKPQRPGDTSQALDRHLAQLRAELFSPLGSENVAQDQDIYLDLLRQIRDNRTLASGGQLATTNQPKNGSGLIGANPAAQPSDSRLGGAAFGSAYASSSEEPVALKPPTAAQLHDAAEARTKALRAARGLPEQPPAANGNQPNAPAAEDVSDDLAPLPGQLGTTVGALKYDLPALTTLSGAHGGRINDLLRGAETDMAAQRYFDAEAKYRLVQEFSPDQPLAIIGQIHAELGAGLTRSAGINLRTLLAAHPELAAARYDSRLLPRADRLTRARNELEEMIRTSNRPEPAILLAYLGYQTRSAELTRYGLDLAQANAPRDPVVVLLRHIWLPNSPAAKPAGGGAPSGAAGGGAGAGAGAPGPASDDHTTFHS